MIVNEELYSIKQELKKYYPGNVHPFENIYEHTPEYQCRVEKVKFEAEATRLLYNDFLQNIKLRGIFLAYDFTMIPWLHRCRTFIIKENFSSAVAHVFHISFLMPYYFSYTAILKDVNNAENHLPGCLDFSDLPIVKGVTMGSIEQNIQNIFPVKKLEAAFVDEKVYDRIYIGNGFTDDCTVFYALFLDDYIMHTY